MSVETTAIAAADPAVGAAINTANQVVNALPPGELKTSLQTFLTADPSKIATMINNWIMGYQYTGGDYALGEIFVNRVTNKATTSRWDIPNNIVPLAWYYMTTLFGLPVAVNTDLDQLLASNSLEGYLSGRPEQRGFVTQEQVDRAHQLINTPGVKPVTQTNPQWGVDAFSVLPYVQAIPDPRLPGKTYSGILPNGQQVMNGLPVTEATSGSDISIGGSNTIIYIVIAIVIVILFIIIIA